MSATLRAWLIGLTNSDVKACTGLGLTGIPRLGLALAFIHCGNPAVLMDLLTHNHDNRNFIDRMLFLNPRSLA